MKVRKNVLVQIALLRRQWRKGMRWCVYRHPDGFFTEDVIYFQRYEQAEYFCKDHLAGERSLYKIVVIADILQRLHQTGSKKRKALQPMSKMELCKQFPALSFPSSLDHADSIPLGIYFPVVWYKIVNPLTNIRAWIVTWNGRSDTIDFCHEDYATALSNFMKCTETMIFLESRDVLKLQASIGDSIPERYVEIFRYYYHPRRQCYMLDKKTDGSKPFLLPVTYFARYNVNLQRLEFFDEGLKKIKPGLIGREVDLRYFDFVDE